MIAPGAVSLVGMPGVGKSTVGRLLSKRLLLPLIDIDQVFETQYGVSIATFFSIRGEVAFRSEESRLLEEAISGPASVISTGGGVVLQEKNRALLHDRTTVIYLQAKPETLVMRLQRSHQRPLLQGEDIARKVEDLYAVRSPLYMSIADIVVDVGHARVNTVVRSIIAKLGR